MKQTEYTKALAAVGQHYDAIAKEYDEFYKRPIDLAEDIAMFRLLGTRLDGRSVLDVGCGTGLLLEHLNPNYYLGVDISNGMLDVAREKFPDRDFRWGDMGALPPLSHQFGAVVSIFGSFSHCVDPPAAVKCAYDALRPGGLLFYVLHTPRGRDRVHITNGSILKAYTTAQALHLFSPFKDVLVTGFNTLVDQSLTHNEDVDQLVSWLRVERFTVGRFFPDQGYFLIVEGTKPCPEEE